MDPPDPSKPDILALTYRRCHNAFCTDLRLRRNQYRTQTSLLVVSNYPPPGTHDKLFDDVLLGGVVLHDCQRRRRTASPYSRQQAKSTPPKDLNYTSKKTTDGFFVCSTGPNIPQVHTTTLTITHIVRSQADQQSWMSTFGRDRPLPTLREKKIPFSLGVQLGCSQVAPSACTPSMT